LVFRLGSLRSVTGAANFCSQSTAREVRYKTTVYILNVVVCV
jgi:hypothetical protein